MKAVVLGGGLGKRLRPLTNSIPKVMVRVKGEPLLAHILRGLRDVVDEVIIVVGYLKDVIINHFGDEFEGIKLRYVVQTEYKGTAHAPLFAEKFIDRKFFLVYGDLYFNPAIYKEMLRQDADGVIAAKKVPNPQDYGVLELDSNGFLKGILEKVPNPPSNLINAGIYLFPPEILDACKRVKLSKRGEYELTDAIILLVKEGFSFKPVVIDKWIDVGTPERLRQAELMSFP